MEVKEKEASVGLFRMEVIGNYVCALARVLGCGEAAAQMCFSDATMDNHLGLRGNINGESFRELGGVLCFRLDMPEESSSKDNSYMDQALNCQLKSDGNSLGFSSSMENKECWLVQTETFGVEVGVEENMLYFYASVLTKILGSEKNVQVCICHVSSEDSGFCRQSDEQCVLEQVGKDSGCLEKNWVHTFAIIGLFVTVDKTLTGSKGYAYLGCTTEEVSASALKEIDSKRVNGSAQAHCPKYSIAPLRPSSPEPPDVG